jgi:hypothetical protein
MFAFFWLTILKDYKDYIDELSSISIVPSGSQLIKNMGIKELKLVMMISNHNKSN